MLNTMNVVAFLGPVGHGKSRLQNKICGTAHASGAGSSSCTRSVEGGINQRHNLFVIGTPGFGSSDDVASHIAAQKLALEGIPLSGVYAVIKYESRADNLCRQVETLMDFLGSDDVRVIITHVDTASTDDGFDLGNLKKSMSNLLSISEKNICFVGRDTPGDEIAQFVSSTLHEPKKFSISDTQVAAVSGLTSVRKYNKPINKVLAHIKVATEACQKLLSDTKESYETDLAIIATQNLVRKMVADEKERIFREAFENIASEVDQNIVYGKAGVSLSLALQNFVKTTNTYLSWDVTNPRDPRNIYRKCPFCDAVYVLVAGCLNVYRCGGEGHIPDNEAPKSSETIFAEFFTRDETIWIRYRINDRYYDPQFVRKELSKFTKLLAARARKDEEAKLKLQQATKNGTRELNIFCGNSYTWNDSHILSPDELKKLGAVDFEKAGELEELSGKIFKKSIDAAFARNREILHENMQCLDIDPNHFNH